jgi:hypothetical protein
MNHAYRHYIARIGKPPGPMLDDYAVRVSEAGYDRVFMRKQLRR